MMKVLIIGGTRFIGEAIATQCLQQGHSVTLFNRSISNPSAPFALIKGDIQDLLQYKDKLLKVEPDIVIHCIAYTAKEAQDCVEIFQKTSTRTIVLSSQDCYNAFQLLIRGKEGSDFPISESMELSTIKYYWRGMGKHSGGENYDKNLMTDVFMSAFKEKRCKPTIFRLPMVYGPKDHQYAFRHGDIIRRIYDKRKTLVMGQLEQNRIFTYGYIENIVAAILHSLSYPQTIGSIYNLGETKVRSQRRWAQLYAQVAQWDFDYTIVPDEIINTDQTHRNRPPQHLIFDCNLYQKETTFVPPVPILKAVEKTLEWALENPDILGEKPDYKKEEQIAKKYVKLMESFCSQSNSNKKT